MENKVEVPGSEERERGRPRRPITILLIWRRLMADGCWGLVGLTMGGMGGGAGKSWSLFGRHDRGPRHAQCVPRGWIGATVSALTINACVLPATQPADFFFGTPHA